MLPTVNWKFGFSTPLTVGRMPVSFAMPLIGMELMNFDFTNTQTGPALCTPLPPAVVSCVAVEVSQTAGLATGGIFPTTVITTLPPLGIDAIVQGMALQPAGTDETV